MELSYEDELDAIWRRTEQTINLDRIKSKGELRQAVLAYKEENGQQGGWSSRLNSLIWDRIKQREEQGEEYFVNRAVSEAKSVFIGVNTAAKKAFSAVFNKKSGGSQIIARDTRTGRFTKFTEQEFKTSTRRN